MDYFNDQSLQTGGDLRMLCYFGGRQHTLEQLGGLAAPAGLRIVLAGRPDVHCGTVHGPLSG